MVTSDIEQAHRIIYDAILKSAELLDLMESTIGWIKEEADPVKCKLGIDRNICRGVPVVQSLLAAMDTAENIPSYVMREFACAFAGQVIEHDGQCFPSHHHAALSFTELLTINWVLPFKRGPGCWLKDDLTIAAEWESTCDFIESLFGLKSPDKSLYAQLVNELALVEEKRRAMPENFHVSEGVSRNSSAKSHAVFTGQLPSREMQQFANLLAADPTREKADIAREIAGDNPSRIDSIRNSFNRLLRKRRVSIEPIS